LHHWVGCLGRNPQTITPNIDRLASRGLVFRHAYTAAPLCNPSRFALFSGMRPATTGIYDQRDDWREKYREDVLLPTVFRRAGYYCAGAGKLYHGANKSREAWDDSLREEKDKPPKPKGDKGVGQITFAPLDCEDDDLGDYVTTSYIIEQLGKKHDKPFFLGCGLVRPHLPWYVPRKNYDMHPLESIELPPHTDNDLADVPPTGVAMAQPESNHAKILASGRWKEAVQGYLAAISYTDMNVGRVLDALDASPYRDNTIVVLWGDHGWHLGEKEHWRKSALWEEATRIPFIWVAPGVTKPGTFSERTVDSMAWYPTLCDLCGVQAPLHLEGVSVRKLLANPQAAWERPAMTTHLKGNHAVRTEEWRYIRYSDGGEELYNESADPYERTNLASESKQASTKA